MVRIDVAAAVVLLAVALTGCSTVVEGRAEPADHNGPVAVPETALGRALLDGDELDKVMDADGIEQKSTLNKLASDSRSFPDHACLGPWQPIQESVYDDSGWSTVRARALHDKEDSEASEHLVVEAVVGFPSRSEVSTFFDQMKPTWEACGARQFTSRTSAGTETRWDFGAVTATDSTLSMTRTQQDTDGWSCQRAMRATNNVVVDVLACSFDVDQQAVAIVDAIDAKLPSV